MRLKGNDMPCVMQIFIEIIQDYWANSRTLKVRFILASMEQTKIRWYTYLSFCELLSKYCKLDVRTLIYFFYLLYTNIKNILYT